jgi:hypothetical protein
VARIIHTESKGEHGAAELEMLKVKQIVNTDGWKVDNRLSLNGIHHKRINHDNPWSMARCVSTAQRAPEAMQKAYNGGFIRNDRLFRRERPLSFSHRNDDKCLDYLQGYSAQLVRSGYMIPTLIACYYLA